MAYNVEETLRMALSSVPPLRCALPEWWIAQTSIDIFHNFTVIQKKLFHVSLGDTHTGVYHSLKFAEASSRLNILLAH